MKLNFEKWHGAKNDFIILWMRPSDVEWKSLESQAASLCSRKGDGVGADGLLILEPASDRQELLPQKLTIINSDGSRAATCGNGIRVASLSVLKRFWEADFKVEVPDSFNLKLADSSEVMVRFLGEGSLQNPRKNWPYVSVAMGVPQLDASFDAERFSQIGPEIERISKEIDCPELLNEWNYVHIGNEHLVFQMPNANHDTLLKVGPALQHSKLWDGINVHLVIPKAMSKKDEQRALREIQGQSDELLEVLVWERGAGETQACGSGACAVAKVALAGGMIERDNWVTIDMPGGRLYCQQKEDDEPMLLAGPGQLVFGGVLEL